jgi:hypothetical protein
MKGDTHFISISHTLDGLQEGVDGFDDVTLKILIDQLLRLRKSLRSFAGFTICPSSSRLFFSFLQEMFLRSFRNDKQ